MLAVLAQGLIFYVSCVSLGFQIVQVMFDVFFIMLHELRKKEVFL